MYRHGPAAHNVSRPLVIAHRGFDATYPENTIEAIRSALDHADAIEIDVRRCATGELVAVHDATLTRIASWPAKVEDIALTELRGVDVRGSGATIPTLEAVLSVIPPDVPVVLDLKEPDAAPDVISLLDEFENRVRVASFHPRALAIARETDPRIPTAFAVSESRRNLLLRPIPRASKWAYRREDVGGMIEQARTLGCEMIHPRYQLCLHTDLVPLAHDAGLGVAAWTIDSQEAFDALCETGVDGVFSAVPPQTWE